MVATYYELLNQNLVWDELEFDNSKVQELFLAYKESDGEASANALADRLGLDARPVKGWVGILKLSNPCHLLLMV